MLEKRGGWRKVKLKAPIEFIRGEMSDGESVRRGAGEKGRKVRYCNKIQTTVKAGGINNCNRDGFTHMRRRTLNVLVPFRTETNKEYQSIIVQFMEYVPSLFSSPPKFGFTE